MLNPELERPLGQDRPAGKAGRRIGFPRPAAMLGGMVLVAAIAGSAWFAFDRDPLREGDPVEVTSVPAGPADEEPALKPVEAPAQPDAGSGPSIITVKPTPRPDDGGSSVVIIRNPTAAEFNPRIAHLPDRDLLEDSEFGPLPVRSADGRRPMDAYARPWSGARGARVAIVIGGLAVSQTGTQTAIAKLPPEVTLAFASGGNSIQRWMQEARRDGHEILMQLPMEPFDYPAVNPGRDTLTTDAPEDQNMSRLLRVLSKTTNYTGVMNYMGARFTAEEASFSPVVTEIGRRGLLYLDDGTSARSMADDLAQRSATPFAAADMVIDGERDRGAILKKLDDLERTARAQGSAIGTGSAFDVTVDAVTEWVTEATRRGIEVVPVSALVRDPER